MKMINRIMKIEQINISYLYVYVIKIENVYTLVVDNIIYCL